MSGFDGNDIPASRGWYPDPDGGSGSRYFDGERWTALRSHKPPSEMPELKANKAPRSPSAGWSSATFLTVGILLLLAGLVVSVFPLFGVLLGVPLGLVGFVLLVIGAIGKGVEVGSRST